MIGNPLQVEDIISEMRRGGIRVPEIQRSYVWRRSQIARLLDSVYRDYPAGSILLWDTIEPIIDRELATDLGTGVRTDFVPKIVLDGQQRVTSLGRVFNDAVPKSERILFNLMEEVFEPYSPRNGVDPRWLDVTEILTGQITELDVLDRLVEAGVVGGDDKTWNLLARSYTIMTSRSPGVLSRLVARSYIHALHPGHKHLALIDGIRGRRTEAQAEIAVMGLDVDDWLREPHSMEPIETFVVLGHSTDDYVRGVNWLLCGWSALPDHGKRERPLPQCCYGMGCRIEGVRVERMRDLRARLIFVAGCDSLRLSENAFGEDIDLALSAIEGSASAYVGCHALVDASAPSALLFRNLMLSGCTLGDAIRELNNSMVASGRSVAHWSGLGDVRWSTASVSQSVRTADVRRVGDRSWKIAFQGLSGAILAKAVIRDREALLGALRGQMQVELVEADGHGDDLMHSVVPSANGVEVHVYLYSWDRLTIDRAELHLTCGDQRAQLTSFLRELQENTWLARMWGSVRERLRGKLHELEGLQIHLAKSMASADHDAKAAADGRNTVGRVEKLVLGVSRTILGTILEQCHEGRLRLVDEMLGQGRLSPGRREAAVCPECARPATRRVLEHRTLPIRALWLTCPNCGLVGTSNEPASVTLRLGRMPSHTWLTSNEGLVRELVVENVTDHVVVGSVGLQIRHGKKLGVRVTPPIADMRLGPHEIGAYSYFLESEQELRPHRYILVAYAVANLGVYSLSERLFVQGVNPQLPEPGDRLESILGNGGSRSAPEGSTAADAPPAGK